MRDGKRDFSSHNSFHINPESHVRIPYSTPTVVISQGAKRSDCYAKLSSPSKPVSNSDLKSLELQLQDEAKVYGGS